MLAPTTPTWLRPISMTVLHAAPSVNMQEAVAKEMSTAATTGVGDEAATISATPEITYMTALSRHRPAYMPNFADRRSVTTPPNRSLGTLTSSGRPEKNPSDAASYPWRS